MQVSTLGCLNVRLQKFSLANWKFHTIVLSGGSVTADPHTSVKNAWGFDLKSGKWSKARIADMNLTRSRHSSCTIENRVYIIFGHRPKDEYPSMESL